MCGSFVPAPSLSPSTVEKKYSRLMPAPTGPTARRTRSRIAPDGSRVGSYETRKARRSRKRPRVIARRPTTQDAFVAWPSSGRGWLRSSARPSTCRRAWYGVAPRGADSNLRQRSCALRRRASSSASRSASSVGRRSAGRASTSKNVIVSAQVSWTAPTNAVPSGTSIPRARRQLADLAPVRHPGEEAGVGPAAPPAARAARVRGEVGVVHGPRVVAHDRDERREPAREADALEQRAHARRLLVDREAVEEGLVRLGLLPVPLGAALGQARLRRGQEAPRERPAEPPREPRREDAGEERQRREQAGGGRHERAPEERARRTGERGVHPPPPPEPPLPHLREGPVLGGRLLVDQVAGLDDDRAEGERRRVVDPLVSDREVEEARGAEGLVGRGEGLEVPPDRLGAIVDAGDHLEAGRRDARGGGMGVSPIANTNCGAGRSPRARRGARPGSAARTPRARPAGARADRRRRAGGRRTTRPRCPRGGPPLPTRPRAAPRGTGARPCRGRRARARARGPAASRSGPRGRGAGPGSRGAGRCRPRRGRPASGERRGSRRAGRAPARGRGGPARSRGGGTCRPSRGGGGARAPRTPRRPRRRRRSRRGSRGSPAPRRRRGARRRGGARPGSRATTGARPCPR